MTVSDFTSRAIAYLKSKIPEHDPAPALELSHLESPVLRPFARGLLVSYVVDEGESFKYVQRRHLEQDRLSDNELHHIGLKNLTDIAYSGRLKIHAHPSGSMFAATMGGNFEASLMLIDELWDDTFRQFVSGCYAVAIPARDILAFCDENCGEGLAELCVMIGRTYPVCDHSLSDNIFVRRDGEWIPMSV